MNFERVRINKTDTCLTYIFKRIGLFNSNKFYSLEIYDEYFDSKICDDIFTLKPGDIVMWTAKEHMEQYPFEILENGTIITHNVLRGRHVALIEQLIDDKTILYSDCSRKNSDAGIPRINMKNLCETRQPDYVLTIKK